MKELDTLLERWGLKNYQQSDGINLRDEFAALIYKKQGEAIWNYLEQLNK